jgi:hypothetical protein
MAALAHTRKEILSRILSVEEAIVRAREYLADGKHADWHGFRALFVPKRKAGQDLPPHKDWVRNVFLPQMEYRIQQSELALERLERKDASRAS